MISILLSHSMIIPSVGDTQTLGSSESGKAEQSNSEAAAVPRTADWQDPPTPKIGELFECIVSDSKQ